MDYKERAVVDSIYQFELTPERKSTGGEANIIMCRLITVAFSIVRIDATSSSDGLGLYMHPNLLYTRSVVTGERELLNQKSTHGVLRELFHSYHSMRQEVHDHDPEPAL